MLISPSYSFYLILVFAHFYLFLILYSKWFCLINFVFLNINIVVGSRTISLVDVHKPVTIFHRHEFYGIAASQLCRWQSLGQDSFMHFDLSSLCSWLIRIDKYGQINALFNNQKEFISLILINIIISTGRAFFST